MIPSRSHSLIDKTIGMFRPFCIEFVLILYFWLSGFFAFAQSGELTITQVFKNVFTVSPQGPSGPNSTFIITNEGVLVIDSGGNLGDARKILAEIRQRTVHPIKFVINTHYHGTHTFGNPIFRKEGATIISHKNVQRALAGKRGKMELERLQKKSANGLKIPSVVLPNLIFENKLELIFGGYHIELISQGHALTDGDIIVYLPDFKTIIAGGLVNNRVIPFMPESRIEDWIQSLSRIEDYKAEIVIPGFGPVGEKPTAIQMRHYLLDLKQQILAHIEEDKSLEETLKSVSSFIKNKYSNWAGQEYSEANIGKVFKEYLDLHLVNRPKTSF